MTKEERAVDFEKTCMSLVMIPIETVQEMKEDDRKRKERDKQRGNTKCPSGNDGDAAVPDPFENDMILMKMTTTTTTGTTTSSLKTATTTMVAMTPMTTTTPMTTATPMTNTLSQPMTRRQRRRTVVKEKPHKCHPDSQKCSLGMPENT